MPTMKGPFAECDICRNLPERAYADLEKRERLPIESEKLHLIGGYDNHYCEVWKCPFCSTYYQYSHDYETSPCGSPYDAETLSRIDMKSALNLIRKFLKDMPDDKALKQELQLIEGVALKG